MQRLLSYKVTHSLIRMRLLSNTKPHFAFKRTLFFSLKRLASRKERPSVRTKHHPGGQESLSVELAPLSSDGLPRGGLPVGRVTSRTERSRTTSSSLTYSKRQGRDFL